MELSDKVENGATIECFRRVFNICPKCKRDFDLSHYPNNFDCPYFQPFKMVVYDIQNPDKLYSYK